MALTTQYLYDKYMQYESRLWDLAR